MQVTLAESDDFELSGNAVYVVAVPAGESTVVSYKVTATEFGEIPLQGELDDGKSHKVLLWQMKLALWKGNQMIAKDMIWYTLFVHGVPSKVY